MVTCLQEIDALEKLRQYVNETICYHSQLQLGAFPMTERILVRSGEPCGVYFCVHGPRSTKFSAIWETDHNRILFYGCRGERLLKTELADAPVLQLTGPTLAQSE